MKTRNVNLKTLLDQIPEDELTNVISNSPALRAGWDDDDKCCRDRCDDDCNDSNVDASGNVGVDVNLGGGLSFGLGL